MKKKFINLSELLKLQNFEDNTYYLITVDCEFIKKQDCKENFYFQSNNDAGVKNIAFYLKKNNNITLDFDMPP